MKKSKKFSIPILSCPTGVEIEFKKVFLNKDGIKLVLHRPYGTDLTDSDRWVISDYRTGRSVNCGRTIKLAEKEAERILKRNGITSQVLMDKKSKSYPTLNI